MGLSGITFRFWTPPGSCTRHLSQIRTADFPRSVSRSSKIRASQFVIKLSQPITATFGEGNRIRMFRPVGNANQFERSNDSGAGSCEFTVLIQQPCVS